MKRIVPASVALLMTLSAVLAACAGGPSSTSPATTSTAAPPVVASPVATRSDLLADIEVDGRTFHVVCVGPLDTGRPTVIFEVGLGGEVGVWSDVLSQLQATDRACAYDRL